MLSFFCHVHLYGIFTLHFSHKIYIGFLWVVEKLICPPTIHFAWDAKMKRNRRASLRKIISNLNLSEIEDIFSLLSRKTL